MKAYFVVAVCVIYLQGPPGLPGLPGEPGTDGIGIPGPKVCHPKADHLYINIMIEWGVNTGISS